MLLKVRLLGSGHATMSLDFISNIRERLTNSEVCLTLILVLEADGTPCHRFTDKRCERFGNVKSQKSDGFSQIHEVLFTPDREATTVFSVHYKKVFQPWMERKANMYLMYSANTQHLCKIPLLHIDCLRWKQINPPKTFPGSDPELLNLPHGEEQKSKPNNANLC